MVPRREAPYSAAAVSCSNSSSIWMARHQKNSDELASFIENGRRGGDLPLVSLTLALVMTQPHFTSLSQPYATC